MTANQNQSHGFRSLADVEQFSKNMMTAMDELTEVIEAETDLVRAGKLVAATSLQTKKSKHAENYIALVNQARSHGQTIKALAPAAADRLSAAQDMFKSTLQINLAALATAREVSEGLIRGVAHNMARQEKPTTYTAGAAQSTAYNAPATGVAVNRSA